MTEVQGLLGNRQDNINCNNFNLNANGFNVKAMPESLSGFLPAEAKTGFLDIGSNKIENEEKRFGSDNKT